MAKVGDHDSTMEVSTSQLVSDVPAQPAIPKNDRSVWAQVVVGTEQFAPAPAAAPARRARGILLVCGLAVVAAIGGYVAFAILHDDDDPAPARETSIPSAVPSPDAAPPAAKVTKPAGKQPAVQRPPSKARPK